MIRLERRSAAHAPSVQVRAAASGSGLQVAGYASVTGQAYDVRDFLGTYSETVSRGAFSSVLARQPDTRLLVNHEGVPLARTASGTLMLREVTTPAADPLGQGLTGLWMRADLDASNPRVQEVRSAMTRGDLGEMSFAFTVARQDWDSAYENRWIDEIGELLDVSLVTYPANPATVATLE